jgi:hypothetical protein
MLVACGFSRHAAALEWARESLVREWGPIELASEPFAFTETDYYQEEMGAGLVKQFWAFEQRIDPAELPRCKLQTNALEAAYAKLRRHGEARPLNVDPGTLSLSKLMLASSKDHAHRVYVGRGIYAEVTLHFSRGAWQPQPWTYPDYRRPDYAEFFTRCRELLRRSPLEGRAE